jgi:hypothetical protein
MRRVATTQAARTVVHASGSIHAAAGPSAAHHGAASAPATSETAGHTAMFGTPADDARNARRAAASSAAPKEKLLKKPL